MFCPNCGTQSASANVYCKRCGEWLHDPKALARMEFGGTSPEENLKVALTLSALSAAFALVCAALIYFGRASTPGGGPTFYLVAAFCLTIALWQFSIIYVVLKLRKRFRQKREGETALATPPQPQPGAALPRAADSARSLDAADTADFIRARSVVDRTTELLQPAERRPTGGREGET